MDNCLKFLKVFLKILPVPEALGANATERQVLGGACFVVFAVATSKIFAASAAGLEKNHIRVEDAADLVHEVFDVVAALDGVRALLAIIVQPRVYQSHELFFFHPRKLERFLV